MNERQVIIHQRALPHWRVDGGTYFVTMRLADSLPAEVLRNLRQRVASIPDQRERNERMRSLAHRYLDEGYGSCVLRDANCASLVRDVFLKFDGDRYRLGPWSVLPNHAHTIVKPLGMNSLDEIVGDWKSVSAHRINKLLGRRGTLWQDEPYDSWLRDQNDLDRVRLYILRNPEKAGLKNWPFVGDPDTTGILDY
jgi:REP element-mobilizing transposase RayT